MGHPEDGGEQGQRRLGPEAFLKLAAGDAEDTMVCVCVCV